MNRCSLRTPLLALGVAALLATGCSSDVRRPGSSGGGGGGGEPKDSGVVTPDLGFNVLDFGVNVDLGTNVPDFGAGVDLGFPPNDAGMQQGCGHNPNNCVAHQIINTTDCSCLPFCEQGWVWNAGTMQCDVNGMMGRPDSGPYDGGIPTTDPFDIPTLAGNFARALCQRQTRCEPAIYGFFGQNEAQCITETTQGYITDWGLVSMAIQQNRVGFARSALDRCIMALNSADCIDGLNVGDCAGIFRGAQAVGQPCSFSVECVDTAFCGAVQGALNPLCGACQPRAASGADCSAAACAPGNRCLDVGGQRLCIPNTASAGQTCGTVQTGLCRGRNQCIGSQTFQCMRPAGQGQTCDPMGQSGPGCNIYQNQICVGTTCQSVNWVGAGQSCVEPSQCNSTSRCDNMSCVAWPTAGQPCFMGECADGNYCEVATCAAVKQAGAQCQTSVECAEDLSCLMGTCQAIGYTFCQ